MGVFDQAGATVQWRGGHETVRIEPWGADSLRVRGTLWPEVRDDLPGALLAPAAADGARSEITPDLARVVNGRLTGVIDSRGRMRFTRTRDGAVLLAEVMPHFNGPGQRRYAPAGQASGLHHVEVLFDARDDERFYGLGQHQHGKLDQKGAVIELVQRNTEVSVPFLLSSLGYGFLWNHPGVGRVELGTTLTRWVSEASGQWDYWITAGDAPVDIVRRYADATGRAPMLPDWASGFWQSKLRYRTQDELLQVAREYRRRGLPLSVIVVDYFHWTRQGDWRFDPGEWPDPAGMIAELDRLGVKLMVSVWPTVNPASENHAEMTELGLLAANERGVGAHLPLSDKGLGRRCDGQLLRRHEPPGPGVHLVQGHGRLLQARGPGVVAGRVRARVPARAARQSALSPGSGPGGRQRLPAAARAGLLRRHDRGRRGPGRPALPVSVGGQPAVRRRRLVRRHRLHLRGPAAADPGRAEHRPVRDPVVDHGHRRVQGRGHRVAVVPRAAGPLVPVRGVLAAVPAARRPAAKRDVRRRADRRAERAVVLRDRGIRDPAAMAGLREHLRPYVMAAMRVAHTEGLPVMRPLFLEFPHDQTCWDIADEFLLGADLLVAPVLTEGAREREVYLPAGAGWRDAWTGACLSGGQRLTADAPLDVIPVYVRDGGSVEPFGDLDRFGGEE